MKISVAKADYEGNPTYFTKNATLAVDKVSLNCHSVDTFRNQLLQLILDRALLKVGDDITLLPNFITKEKGYRYVVDVKYLNKKIVQLAFSPTMTAMQQDSVKVKVFNHVLYEVGWTDSVNYVLQLLNLQLKSITELHIAMDAGGIADDFLNLYNVKCLDLGADRISGRHRSKQLSIENGFHYNSKSSDVHFTFYDKSKEYREKPYLKQFHVNNDLGDRVQRIELRAKSIGKLTFSGVTLSQLGDVNVLRKIFEVEFQKRIVFKNTDSSKMYYDKNRNRKSPIIQMVKFPEEGCEVVLLKRTGISIEHMKSKKTTAKNLFMHVLENPKRDEISTLRSFLNRNNLLEWFNGKVSTWGVGDPDYTRVIKMTVNETLLPDEGKSWFDRMKQTVLSKIVMSVPDIRIVDLPREFPVQMAA